MALEIYYMYMHVVTINAQMKMVHGVSRHQDAGAVDNHARQ